MIKKIVKYSTSWCGPCRAFHPTFHKVEKDEKYKDIVFEDVDIDTDENADAFIDKYRILTVPTTILLDENDELITKFSGNISEARFKEIIDERM